MSKEKTWLKGVRKTLTLITIHGVLLGASGLTALRRFSGLLWSLRICLQTAVVFFFRRLSGSLSVHLWSLSQFLHTVPRPLPFSEPLVCIPFPSPRPGTPLPVLVQWAALSLLMGGYVYVQIPRKSMESMECRRRWRMGQKKMWG